ncbi:helix-turn-helix transcriptional regulator [Shewanella frigidimarina]|uniref:helix-turn-helix domain-containing protein n=1 Tax=Shewanella frigidimarina TaxID=56812 RepID=UPI0031751EF2
MENILKCNLSRILGEKRLKVSDVARDTDINRGTITRLYNETATRVELDVIETLCHYLNIEIDELLELEEKTT